MVLRYVESPRKILKHHLQPSQDLYSYCVQLSKLRLSLAVIGLDFGLGHTGRQLETASLADCRHNLEKSVTLAARKSDYFTGNFK